MEISDTHVGILVELYWNGSQRSRTTPNLRNDIEELIDEGLLEEFRQDWVFFGMVWLVRLTPQGKDVLMSLDPMRVYNVLVQMDLSAAAQRWLVLAKIRELGSDRLPEFLASSYSDIRGAATKRLEELNGTR